MARDFIGQAVQSNAAKHNAIAGQKPFFSKVFCLS
jgi:hypothetical protein